MKKLKPVNIHIDDCMDADDYEHRLTECIEHMSENTNVVNLVKVRVGDGILSENFMRIMKDLAKNIRKMSAKVRNMSDDEFFEYMMSDVTEKY